MRKTLVLSALMLTGCGPISPELYALVVDFFTLPDSCYSNAMQPSSGTVSDSPSLLQVQVWDGPDSTAVLEVEQGSRSGGFDQALITEHVAHSWYTDYEGGLHPREGQRGIIIGKGGERLKAIGTAARARIEELLRGT